ncbi:Gfo/Idh/MocA family protein [Vibrio rumoiensis]|uniref:Oxidoreductase n=1 Tax=Vibrio rumoiensis 1S-45 TaxID=1188252 RepID=A0A1E5E137_9VIBR|nr:Gfo/Idh/MocA family oxidoreductase [Vibrio rumoiensis]OEF24272.1 oxidoreductase [Vibrio rumoiensis 1S-45]
MKIALIGLGGIAQKAYLPFITQLEGVEWVFCTRNAETLGLLAQKYKIRETYTDYQQLIHANIDAVMIHSATQSHLEIASFFLSNGIATFVDKPLAANAHDCETLYELSSRKQTPLYVGFNRRHIPLFNQHLIGVQSGMPHTPLLSLRWEKHRFNQPGDIRTFIFDDFIHPLDSVNIYAQPDVQDLQITSQWDTTQNQLGRLDVQWQQQGSLLHASMNRLFGTTQERVSANFANQSYEFSNFTEGTLWQLDKAEKLQAKDWMPMLTTKGFDSMIQEWLGVVKTGHMPSSLVERNLATHQLAEAICQHVLAQKTRKMH